MSSPDEKLREMSELIQREHGDQTRNAGRTPYWMHCETVSETLSRLLAETGETTEDSLDILLAAKGHDLYEDTRVDPEKIRQKFGERVHSLIDGMTNRGGDTERAAYVEYMKTAPEEIRLIKLSDLLDNYRSGATALTPGGLGTEWVKGYLLPILDEMWPAVKNTSFMRYPKTAEKLCTAVDAARKKLHSMLPE